MREKVKRTHWSKDILCFGLNFCLVNCEITPWMTPYRPLLLLLLLLLLLFYIFFSTYKTMNSYKTMN